VRLEDKTTKIILKMINAIIGDPYQFSIVIGDVKEWNAPNSSHSFFNGLLVFSINGELFPSKEVLNATLSCEIHWLKEDLKAIVVNEEIFCMEKEKAFIEMYNKRFPENIDISEDFRYYISPQEFGDKGYYVFAVSNGKQIRIMVSKLKYIKKHSRHNLNNIHINEVFISNAELNKIILKLEKVDEKIKNKTRRYEREYK
jgi:hypothetical protein